MKKSCLPGVFLLVILLMAGCGGQDSDEPMLRVYLHEEDIVRQMPMEMYLEGVVAGEMKNTFPLEALKAQAIVARTYTLAKMAEGKKLRDGADASTDIREFQAYRAEAVNDAVKQAVQMTRGQVIEYDGEAIMAWFHASAGGKTATAEEGLGYMQKETPYIVPVASEDGDAPDDIKEWEVVFTQEEMTEALAEMGQTIESIESIRIADSGPSGRAMHFIINDTIQVDAPSLRMALGSKKLPSLLLTDVMQNERAVKFVGSGYGHGVGMSQWGAHHMANAGASAEEIIAHYYAGTTITPRWE